jgi:hypothetical protein
MIIYCKIVVIREGENVKMNNGIINIETDILTNPIITLKSELSAVYKISLINIYLNETKKLNEENIFWKLTNYEISDDLVNYNYLGKLFK